VYLYVNAKFLLFEIEENYSKAKHSGVEKKLKKQRPLNRVMKFIKVLKSHLSLLPYQILFQQMVCDYMMYMKIIIVMIRNNKDLWHVFMVCIHIHICIQMYIYV
jgi:hypothetical protein